MFAEAGSLVLWLQYVHVTAGGTLRERERERERGGGAGEQGQNERGEESRWTLREGGEQMWKRGRRAKEEETAERGACVCVSCQYRRR